MATTKTPPAKPNTPQPQKPKATVSKPTIKKQSVAKQDFLFDKTNYMWMGAGIVLILLGMVLMAGGKSPDPHKFLYEEIYSFRRITLAPIIMLIGFGIELYAIMKKPNQNTTATPVI